MDEEDVRTPQGAIIVGENLERLSIDELDARLLALRDEINRVERIRVQRQSDKSAADAVFKI